MFRRRSAARVARCGKRFAGETAASGGGREFSCFGWPRDVLCAPPGGCREGAEMAQDHKDIYSERERDRALVEERKPGEAEDRWLRSATRNVWSTFVIVLVLVLFLGVMAVVIFFQHRMLREARERQGSEMVPIEVRPAPRAGVSLETDPTGRLILDEIEPPSGEEATATGTPARLTSRWVQQAAFHLRLAERAYRDENWPAALDSYASALRIMPDLDGVREQMGLCHLRSKEFSRAEEIFAESVKRITNSAPLWNNLGVARMGQERYTEAERDLQTAIELDPAYAPARHNLGLLYYRSGNMEKAAATFAQSIKADPSNADVAHMYAVALMKLTQWPEAVAVLQESAGRSPAAAPILFRLAEARSHTKDHQGAMAALKSAMEAAEAKNAKKAAKEEKAEE